MSHSNPTKLYTCVSYPGIIKNEDKMIETLGGLETISHVFSTKNRRLELRFRPDDIYARPTQGDKQRAFSFLLKVKVKRKKKTHSSQESLNTDSDNSKDTILEPIIIGRVETIYRFSNLCDFQYLPVAKNENGVVENIYSDLMPKGFPSWEWFQEPAPHFLPPAIFSRMDTLQSYFFRQEKTDIDGDQSKTNIIGRTRRRRPGYAVFVTFDVPSAPCKPRPSSLKLLEVKFLAKEHYTRMKELFEKRPIWSKTALLCETKYSVDHIKILLPAVAYHFVTGPFRVMWVRIGYDPRKDQSSRIYQTLDYRIPSKGGLPRKIKAKRKADCIQRYQSNTSVSSDPRTLNMAEEERNVKVQPTEHSYIFRRGLHPSSRQMFYQYCDIKVSEVEEMFARLPKLPPDAECNRQRGWLPPGFAERCREIITNILIAQLGNDDDNLISDTEKADETSKQENDLDEQDDDDDDDNVEEDEEDYVEEAYDNDSDDNTELYDNDYENLMSEK